MEYDRISSELIRVVIGNPNAYAEQQADGTYRTAYMAIKRSRIKRMLEHGDSYLSYQIHMQRVRWICLDFDIKKTFIDSGAFDKDKAQFLNVLLEKVRKVVSLLEERHIKCITEFSGNRGIHLWICFTHWLDRKYAYDLSLKILELACVNRDSEQVNVDIFPPTRESKSKLGKGVKIPLSKHKKSQKYSYVIEDINRFEYGEHAWVQELTQDFLDTQATLLEQYELQSPASVFEHIGIPCAIQEANDNEFLTTKKVVLTDSSVMLDTVLDNLKACSALSPIVERYYRGENITEKERAVFVGLINRIVSISGENIGRSLLLEFFSRLPNFKPQLTMLKLDNLHLYPPSCRYLRETFRCENCPCEIKGETVQKSPIELIDGIDIVEDDIFSLSREDLEVIKKAQVRYTQHNDEVALFSVLTELSQNYGDDEIQFYIESLNSPPILESWYNFRRKEDERSFRDLVSLTARDKILTTWFTRIIHSIHGFEGTDNSYGYRFEPSFANGNIFKPWIGQWKQFTRNLKLFIENVTHNSHTVIKLDIKSFYSQINLERLRVKLLDGPSTSGKAAINELDSQTKEKYQTICNALVGYCLQVSNTGRGVPQGPAFARYLAELYLLELDELVGDLIHLEDAHYYRYVDDIFIFIDDNERGVQIDKEVRAFLSSHDLSINESKAFLGSVESYRPCFSQYNDETKYFVDQVSWEIRTVSEEYAKTAINSLSKMLDGDEPGEINPRNLSFFLTHLRDNPLIQQRKAGIIIYLFNFDMGRGSLYRNFHEFYLPFLAKNKYQPNEGLLDILGLHRTVFLNSFLEHLSTQDISENDKPSIKAIISHFASRRELTETEHKLILSIMLLDVKYADIVYISKVSNYLLNECLNYCFSKQITSETATLIRDRLRNVPFSEFVRQLHDVVFKNQLPPEIHPQLAELFFDRVLEQMGKANPEQYNLVLFQKTGYSATSLILSYYELCCLYSLSEPKKNLDKFQRVWSNLISCANNHPDLISKATSWLLKTGEITVNGTNLSLLLTVIIEDGFLPGKVDRQGLFTNYHEQLLFFVVAPDAEGGEGIIILDARRKERLLEYVRDKRMVFLEWILSDCGKISLYPDKITCLKNAAENGLIILQKGSQLLVRANYDYVPAVQFDFLKNLDTTDELVTKYGHRTHIYEFDPNQFEELRPHICKSNKTLVEAMESILDISTKTDQFRNTYLSSAIIGYPNIFIPGFSFNKITKMPLVPFTVFSNRLFVADPPRALRESENNREAFLRALLDFLVNCGKSLLPYDHPVNLKSGNLEEGFFPEQQQRSLDSKMKYICRFVTNYDKIYALSPFDVEFFKCITIWQVNTIVSGKTFEYPTIGTFLSEYHSMYKRGDSHRKLIFGCLDKVNDSTLDSVYMAILDSISKFLESLEISSVNLPILDALATEIFQVKKVINEFKRDPASLSETIKPLLGKASIIAYQKGELLGLAGALKVQLEYDGDTQELKLNGQVLIGIHGKSSVVSFAYVLQLGKSKHSLEELSLSHCVLLSRGQTYMLKKDDTCIFIVISDIIRSSFDTITRRTQDYRNIMESSDGIPKEKIPCYENSYGRIKRIRVRPCFAEATKILQQHHFKSDKFPSESDVELHLGNWLAQFTEPEAEALLSVIAAHQAISQNDINSFMETVNELKRDSFLFSTKSTSDMNGLHRMFNAHTNGQNIFRELLLDNVFDRLARVKITPEMPLVIMSDVSISGKQLNKALEDFYFADKYNERLAIKERYHQLGADFVACRDKLINFRKVYFLLGLHTGKAREVLTNTITKAMKIEEGCIHFSGREVELSDCIIKDNPKIRIEHQKEFLHLAENIKRLQEIFLMTDEQRKYYELSVPHLQYANLMLRINTIPKGALKIFTLKPKNPLIQPLFNCISEHPSIGK